ncbi:MAG: hypothetical protein LBI01_02580 [Elusimicrobium sp.]|jgi:tetratricopeptide (TPR) repeat protein|nr:hypothetical protein [Elusimicrobium sp.]
MKKILILTAVLTFSLAARAAETDDKQMQADVMRYGAAGIEAVYNLDFKTAQQNIDMAFQKYPNHPYAHFGNMLIAWGRYEYVYEKSSDEQKKIFEDVLSSSMDGVKTWLKTHPDDPAAFMALGGAYGIKSLFAMNNKSWISAYFSGRKGIGYMRDALAADPEFYDAYFGLGMYEYYAGTLPSVVKILAKIVSMKGDQTKGIEYLNISREKGNFTRDSSKLLLVEIYLNRISKYYNPPLALQYINEVSGKYPANPLMRFVKIIAEYENKNYDAVLDGGRVFLSRIDKEPFYTEMYIPRSYTAIATALMSKGDFEAAEKTLEEAKEKSFDNTETTRWAVWNLLRLGQSYDALGRRDEAVKIYKLITSLPRSWEIDEEAKKYIKTPFTKETEIGPLPPV